VPAHPGSRLTYANVTATVALFVALGGGAYAVTSFVGSDGQVHACANKKTGQLRAIKKGKHCSKKESSISWSQRGPTGAAGVTGDPGQGGAKGASGPSGATGLAGAALRVQARFSASVSSGMGEGAATDLPFTGSGTWTQRRGEGDVIYVQISDFPPATCDGVSPGLTVLLSPATGTSGRLFEPYPGNVGPHTVEEKPVYLFAPASDTPRTLTLKAFDDCTGGAQRYSVSLLAVDVGAYLAP